MTERRGGSSLLTLALLVAVPGCGTEPPTTTAAIASGPEDQDASSPGPKEDAGSDTDTPTADAGSDASAPTIVCKLGKSDADEDGVTVEQGDCRDCDPLSKPGAYDVPGNKVDEDCNGTADDEPQACDHGLAVDG